MVLCGRGTKSENPFNEMDAGRSACNQACTAGAEGSNYIGKTSRGISFYGKGMSSFLLFGLQIVAAAKGIFLLFQRLNYDQG